MEILIEIMSSYGYIGVMILIFIENIFPPIPSEFILVFGGFMTTYTRMNVWIVILAASIGSSMGAIILYYIGRTLKKEQLKLLLVGKLGKILGFKADYVDKADIWFTKYGYKAVFICRCVPLVRSFISIPAGISQMKVIPFFTLTLLGSTIWNTILVWTGLLAGEAWEKSVYYFNLYSKIIAFIFVIIVMLWLFKKLKNR